MIPAKRALIGLLLVAGVLAFAQNPAEVKQSTSDAVARITKAILSDGKAYEYDQHLADDIGPRLTASASYEKAVQWGLKQFKKLGLENVHTESFPMKAAWEPTC